MPDVIQVIDLYPGEAECHVCDATVFVKSAGPNYGIPIYEDDIVPDDFNGEWGGVPVCRRCYLIVRGAQSEQPGQIVSLAEMRRVARG